MRRVTLTLAEAHFMRLNELSRFISLDDNERPIIAADRAKEAGDALTALLAVSGFDEEYSPTDVGLMCEQLLDKLVDLTDP